MRTLHTRSRLRLPIAAALAASLLSAGALHDNAPPQRLSDFGFFAGQPAAQRPAEGTIPYRLNTPLFSDNATKHRFLRLPAGATVAYNDSSVFDFPVGTALVKTFAFPMDARNPVKGERLIETRVLIREAAGWKALPYVWDEAQSDAFLDVAGDTREVSYTDEEGRRRKHAYQIPNLNQCKGCHNLAERMTPIGPSARQLSGPLTAADKGHSQLEDWAKAGILTGLPGQGELPPAIAWDDPSTGTTEQRSRLWLDINCAHCHRPQGPAGTSGLYLGFGETDPLRLGIGKAPVASGRGSGNLLYDIQPGDPSASILLHRMASTDPGVMMPELGRTQPDPRAVALIREWIAEMKISRQ
jgi:uncharacterized repeat protein (TIGR03806 family)